MKLKHTYSLLIKHTLRNAGIAICLLMVFSCKNRQNIELYYDVTIPDLLNICKTRKICFVLADTSSLEFKKYINNLRAYHNHLSQTAIINVIDVYNPQNRWYLKWLNPVSYPLTGILDNRLNLIDLIPGASYESLSYIDDCLEKGTTTPFHWPNHFGNTKEELLKPLSDLLDLKLLFDTGIYDALLADSINLPNSIELLSLIAQGESTLPDVDIEKISDVNKHILTLITPLNKELYRDDYLRARMFSDPKFTVSNEPSISVVPSQISINVSTLDQDYTFPIYVKNLGELPLNLSLRWSCSCLSHMGTREYTVSGKDSIKLLFNYNPNNLEEQFREILILSNSINSPILKIPVHATPQHK